MLPQASSVSAPPTDQTHWLQKSFCLQVNAACLSRETSDIPPKPEWHCLPFPLSLFHPSRDPAKQALSRLLFAMRQDTDPDALLGG